MKKCSTLLSIKGMYIKTTLRFHLTPAWQSSRKQTSINAGEDARNAELSYTVGRNVSWCNTMEISVEVP
jgi:hypothetical protein